MKRWICLSCLIFTLLGCSKKQDPFSGGEPGNSAPAPGGDEKPGPVDGPVVPPPGDGEPVAEPLPPCDPQAPAGACVSDPPALNGEQSERALELIEASLENQGAVEAYYTRCEQPDPRFLPLFRLLREGRCEVEELDSGDGRKSTNFSGAGCPARFERSAVTRALGSQRSLEEEQSQLEALQPEFASAARVSLLSWTGTTERSTQELGSQTVRSTKSGAHHGTLRTPGGRPAEFRKGVQELALLRRRDGELRLQTYQGSYFVFLRADTLLAQLRVRLRVEESGRSLLEAFLNGRRVELSGAHGTLESKLYGRMLQDFRP